MKKVLTVLLTLGLLVATTTIQAQKTYVGTETCLGCHNPNGPSGASDKTSWRTTKHANGFSYVKDDSYSMTKQQGMVCDADGNGKDDFVDGLDLVTSPNFSKYGTNAPKLAYSAADGYTITIGNLTVTVKLTYGGTGNWKQRYAVQIPTTDGNSKNLYISPIQYNDKTKEWVTYKAGNWYDSNNQPKLDATTLVMADLAKTGIHNLDGGCVGCHATSLDVQKTSDGEWLANSKFQYDATDARANNNPSYYDLNGDGKLDEINTGCETCHGPGSEHYGNPQGIINPERDMTGEQIRNLCGMCHSRGSSKPNGSFGYSYNDDTMTRWTPQDIIDGKGVSDFHSEGNGLWGDGFSSSDHHQQFEEFNRSGSMVNNPYDDISCITCHDAHGSSNEHMIVEERVDDGVTIPTDVDNNTLCLSCHASEGDFAAITKTMVADYANNITAIGNAVSAHTHHPYDPEGNGASRCTNCHMPKITKSGIAYDVHSHTFEVIPPQKTKEFKMPNSCAVSCHDQHSGTGVYPDFGIGLTPDDHTDWAGANQQALADSLMHYYGPDGIWWKHTVDVKNENTGIPSKYVLSQNYPNPFNPSTTIKFAVPNSQAVSIVVYDILGKQIKVLINDNVPAGSYKVTWDASKLASGVYIYRIQAGSFVQSKKMILAK